MKKSLPNGAPSGPATTVAVAALGLQDTRSQRMRAALKLHVTRLGSALLPRRIPELNPVRACCSVAGQASRHEILLDSIDSFIEDAPAPSKPPPMPAPEHASLARGEKPQVDAVKIAALGDVTEPASNKQRQGSKGLAYLKLDLADVGDAPQPSSCSRPRQDHAERRSAPSPCLAFVGLLCSTSQTVIEVNEKRKLPRFQLADSPRSQSPDSQLRSQLALSGVSFDESDALEGLLAFERQLTPADRLTMALSRTTSWLRPPGVPRPTLHGHWVCTGTWGLEAFLVGCKVSMLQRIAALRASWPSWEFKQKGNNITFLNKGPFGTFTEEFTVGGCKYTVVDGWKQTVSCRAFWESDILVIIRSGPQGRFKETRLIDEEGLLQFTLSSLNDKFGDISYGRSFKRNDTTSG